VSLIRRMRRQKAIWWKRLDADHYGTFSFDEPVEIDCRWDGTAQEFLDSKGERQISKAVVYVDRIMSAGDRLMLGEMPSDIPDDPMEVASDEIRRFDQNPNLRATEWLLTAFI